MLLKAGQYCQRGTKGLNKCLPSGGLSMIISWITRDTGVVIGGGAGAITSHTSIAIRNTTGKVIDLQRLVFGYGSILQAML